MSRVRVSVRRRAAALIPDDAIVTVQLVQWARLPGRRAGRDRRALRRSTASPRDLTTMHPIAAGDMYGVKGIDHIAQDGLLARVLAGSYPSGPSTAAPPKIWQMIDRRTRSRPTTCPRGILFDMHARPPPSGPGVLTKVGLDTFVDPAARAAR